MGRLEGCGSEGEGEGDRGGVRERVRIVGEGGGSIEGK